MGLKSVLVAVTGEPADAEAVELACELVGAQKGNLYIVYVIEVERSLPVDAEIIPATARGEEVLQSMERIAKQTKCTVAAEMLQSRRAGHAIVQEAVDKDVDAIVLGIPYKEQYGAFTLGETTPYVLKNAPCRVILWRDAIAESENGHGALR